jgi:RNA polymerase sigma-70 factor, ECF subfamily
VENTAAGKTGHERASMATETRIDYNLSFTSMSMEPEPRGAEAAAGGAITAEATFELLVRVRNHDRQAVDALFARHLPRLRRWARGRLPSWARDAGDTQDLVQETLVQVFKHVERFEPRREGAFQAYLRQAVMNRIRNAVRDRGRRPDQTQVDEAMPSSDLSPVERAIGIQHLERYEAALARLRPIEREAIVARLEMGHSYQEMAEMLGLASADAARKAAQRALARLADEMRRSS